MRSRRLVSALGLLAVAACVAPEPSPVRTWSMDPTARPFAAVSPWNLAIPQNPRLDDDSDALVEALIEDGGGHALLYDFGVPVFEAAADTPTVGITCTQKAWGRCPLAGHRVPVPDGASPSSGSDRAMVVIDRSTGRVYDFWQVQQRGPDGWRVRWGTWASLDGDGVGALGGSTGAGINLLAGLVRTSEIKDGVIDHALALVSDKSCPGTYRYPAKKTDGHASEPPCIPQGARVQLDPAIDVRGISGISPAERAVARALQTYGGYLRDSGGTSLGIAFELPTGGKDPYPGAGLPWDYYDMPNIPWGSLRVLNSWNGR